MTCGPWITATILLWETFNVHSIWRIYMGHVFYPLHHINNRTNAARLSSTVPFARCSQGQVSQP